MWEHVHVHLLSNSFLPSFPRVLLSIKKEKEQEKANCWPQSGRPGHEMSDRRVATVFSLREKPPLLSQIHASLSPLQPILQWWRSEKNEAMAQRKCKRANLPNSSPGEG